MWKSIEEIQLKHCELGRNYVLYFDELCDIYEKAAGSPYNCIINAYDYGFMKGIKYQKAQEKKKRRVGQWTN